MDVGKALAHSLKLSYNIIQAQVKGLTDADSLRQPQPRGNCLNWVLGHIVASRSDMLTLAAIETLWDDADYGAYSSDSTPITSADQALGMARLLSDLKNSQDHLVARLKRMSAKELDAASGVADRTIGERLHFLVWHEAYHVGQTEYLRQLAGTDDKVI